MPSNPIKQSPTATIGTVATATLSAVAWLVAHGIISEHLAKTYGPAAVLVAVAGFFFVTYWHVSPWHKVKDAVRALEDGRLPDADVARVIAGVADVVHEAIGTSYLAQHLTGDDHPDADVIGAPPPDAGMSAGAPGIATA